MSNCKILTRDMLNLPVDVFVEDSDLNFDHAKTIADARARSISGEAMLLAWYDRRGGGFSPRVE